MPSPDEMDTSELQAASVAPLSPAEHALFTKSGKACCWTDAGEYAFRLRQLEIMNYAIQTLAKELWKDPNLINFQALHQDASTYRDVDGHPADNHDWSLIAEDATFKPMELAMNRFKEFEQYMTMKAGADARVMKNDFENFLALFIRIRDSLLKLMSPNRLCPQSMAGGSKWKQQDYRHHHYYY